MPRISEFYGVVVYMYWRDHGPPHFHARYGADEVVMVIDTGEVLAGGLPPTAPRLVQRWARGCRPELRHNWDRAQRGKPLLPIEPLDPDVLRGDHEPADGRSPRTIREYHLRPTG